MTGPSGWGWAPSAAPVPARPVGRSNATVYIIPHRPQNDKAGGRVHVSRPCHFFGLQHPCRRAASSVFTISMARVMGPTPPGTGVMRDAFSATAG